MRCCNGCGNKPSEEGEGEDVDETGFHGVSTAAQGVRRELRALAPTHLPIILVGETGVGKEIAARATIGPARPHTRKLKDT